MQMKEQGRADVKVLHEFYDRNADPKHGLIPRLLDIINEKTKPKSKMTITSGSVQHVQKELRQL